MRARRSPTREARAGTSGDRVNFRTVQDLALVIAGESHRLPREVDVVVGVPRSGLLAAGLLALHWNKPLADVEGLLAGRLLGGGVRLRAERVSELKLGGRALRVLVVDDSVRSGTQMARTRRRIREAGVGWRVTYVAVYGGADWAGKVDAVLEVCDPPRIFDWNWMHHPRLERACVDIDGVLCADPTREENDDGERYAHFLDGARPLYVPTVRVGKLVTCRLERYRRETEAWLARHGIDYGELVMLDLPDGAARRRWGGHGRFKGEVYRRSDARIFVESSAAQAEEIARVAGKAVLCLESRRVVEPGACAAGRARARRAGRRLRRWLRRVGRHASRRSR
jgi:uncharacterized HAD superfamily protein/hypoxanthine phosphoribosyltransferase